MQAVQNQLSFSIDTLTDAELAEKYRDRLEPNLEEKLNESKARKKHLKKQKELASRSKRLTLLVR